MLPSFLMLHFYEPTEAEIQLKICTTSLVASEM